MRQNNGWLKIAHDDSAVHQVVLPASITSWKTEFKRVLQQMPNKWKGNTTELVFLVSPDIETAYRDELSERTTALGDAYLTTSRNAQYQGIDVKPIPFWPGSNKPSIMLTKPKNLAIGIGRSIRTGRQVQERKRVIEYTITAKVDFNYAISDMIVLAEK
jgi:hypothetical protein